MKGGKWDLNKRPVIYEFRADLVCGVCGMARQYVFESRYEPGVAPAETSPSYPGAWRVLAISGGHSDPLRDNIVVCSRTCAERATRDYVDEMYAE